MTTNTKTKKVYYFGNKASERAAIKRNIEYNVKQVYSQIYYEIKSYNVILTLYLNL